MPIFVYLCNLHGGPGVYCLAFTLFIKITTGNFKIYKYELTVYEYFWHHHIGNPCG